MPSVTQILDSNGFVSDFCKSTSHADRGTEIHEMIHLDSMERIEDTWSNNSRVFDLYNKYMDEWEQWRDFLKTSGFRPIESSFLVHGSVALLEGRNVNPYIPDWCGEGDLLCVTPDNDYAIVDIKTGESVPPHTPLQTAGYSMGRFPMDYMDVKRYSLRITSKRKRFKLKEYEDPGDFDKWLQEVKRFHRNQRN